MASATCRPWRRSARRYQIFRFNNQERDMTAIAKTLAAIALLLLSVSGSSAQTATCWSLDPSLGYLCGPKPTPTPTPAPIPTPTPTAGPTPTPTPTPSPIGRNCGLVLGGPITVCDTCDTKNSGTPSRTGDLDPHARP